MTNGSGQGGQSGAAAMPLESLAPSFDEKQHGTYLRRLEEAVKDPRNRNIALTGRYGAGKSSVLDKFAANYAHCTLRLAISTLAPGEEGTTNRIQKEIVKQLLYGASKKVGKNSRFAKIAVLTKRRAVVQSAGVVACLGGLLYLLGWLPDVKWTGHDHGTSVRVTAWAVTAILATLVVSVLRMLTYGRRVSDVSAGPAALTLDDNPDSYFDKFLDEIVHYFGQESKDIVIFEDLDRFEDPGIFEALRELNLLLNETPERRRKSGAPIRFVYALRDSVFEKIDSESAAATLEPGQRLDAAAAETLRANRTKFFDIVISLVPFISHRNARDLLVELLAKRGITGIEASLVNTIAKYCTDMRLMRNMCNEYLVFAERLLEPAAPNKTAPGLDASHLFALVAYKNFHPEDFENITRRDSDLDRLYELHQRMVRDTIALKDRRKRRLLGEPERSRIQDTNVAMLAERLKIHAELVRRVHGTMTGFRVGSKDFSSADISGVEFWTAVAQHKALEIIGNAYQPVLKAFDQDDIGVHFPEALDADRWGEYDENAAHLELAGIETDIEALKRAGFAELVTMPRFTLPEGNYDTGTAGVGETFAQLLKTTLKSDLARDLVRRRFIDRNFSLYAAQFYGNFTGVDVANFMVQHVQTNTMAIDYDLSRAGAVENLLAETEEAGDELEHTVAAFNLDIVNHLLATDDPRAGDVVTNLLASGPDQDARAFLAAYLTADTTERVKLAAYLAEHPWREVFTYLVSNEDVPATARPELVSAALCACDPNAPYELDGAVRDFITANYRNMPAFTERRPADVNGAAADLIPERVAAMLDRAGVIIPELAEVLDDRLRALLVNANRYRLTAGNLRSALGITGAIELDQVHRNKTVYWHCLDYLTEYIVAVDDDPDTGYAITTPAVLESVLNDGVEIWDDELLADPEHGVVAHLLTRAAPESRLSSLRSAPESTWQPLAAANLFRCSLANIDAYRTRAGSVDNLLVTVLQRTGTIYVDGPGDTPSEYGAEDRQRTAVAILNTPMLTPTERVDLIESMRTPLPLPVTEIDPATSGLFALLLAREIVNDDAVSFEHFRQGGWAVIGPAINASNGIKTFLKPEFVSGMVADLLADPAAAHKVGDLIIDDLAEYVPDDDWTELAAVGRYTDGRRPLPPETVVHLAQVATDNGDVDKSLLLRLLASAEPAASADHIVAVFELLGPDYDKIRQTGAVLKFRRDDTHDQLLKVLRDANMVSRTTGKHHYNATVS